ncbi:FAD-dependent oxidoreductase domain-containing protein 2, partial [Bulinus truncatus]
SGETITYVEEFPIHLLHELPKHTGRNGSAYLVMGMEYGHNFSGPGNDVFSNNRATSDPSQAHRSNFLHPVFYLYSSLPTEAMMRTRSQGETLPRPEFKHHTVEDFYTEWDRSHSHILPLRRFLENVLDTDLRVFYSESCFRLAMTHDNVPEHLVLLTYSLARNVISYFY